MTQTMTRPGGGSPAPGGRGQPAYELTDEDKARRARITTAWASYHGEFEQPLVPMEGEADDNVIINQCGYIVEVVTDFLFGKEIEFSVDKGAPADAQTLLDTVWGRKEKRLPLLQDLSMNGSMAGRAFVRIVPSKDNPKKPGKPKKFRLVVLDPATISVQTAPQDCETVLLYCIEYTLNEKINNAMQKVYYHEEITRIDPDGNASRDMEDDDDTWTISHWTRIGEKGNWISAGPAILWPYPFAPIFSCKNQPKPNEFWGRPEVTPDLIGLNNALNLVLSNINRVLKLYAGPVLYAPGTGDTYLSYKTGQIIQLPQADQRIEAVQLHTDLANALKFFESLLGSVDEMTRVPGIAAGRMAAMPRGDMSGVAIELCFLPLLKMIDKKQCLYGELIIDVSKALFVLNNMSGDIDLEIAWQSALPHDDLPSGQYAVLLQTLGISNTTLQRKLGFDPEQELKLSQAEDEIKLQAAAKKQAVLGVPPDGAPGAPAGVGAKSPPPAPAPGSPPIAA